MTEPLQALKESYYEYVGVIPAGLETLQALLESGKIEPLLTSLSNLAEGMEALHMIEQAFGEQGYQVNSRLHESIAIMAEITQILENQAYEQLEGKLKALLGIYESATEWTFVEGK